MIPTLTKGPDLSLLTFSFELRLFSILSSEPAQTIRSFLLLQTTPPISVFSVLRMVSVYVF